MSDTDMWDAGDKDPVARTKEVIDFRMSKLLGRFRMLHQPIINPYEYSLTLEQFTKMMAAIDEQVTMLKALGAKRFKTSSQKFQL